MPERKSIISNIIVGLTVALIMLTISGMFGQNKKINNSVSKEELAEESKKIKDECSEHLTEVMEAHSKVHDETKVQYMQIQSDLTIIKTALIGTK